MTDWFLGASVATLAVSTGVSGLVMLYARRASVSGALLVVVALAGLAGLVLHARGEAPAAEWVLVIGSTVLAFPVSVAAYPRWSWRSPVDFIAVTTLVAGGSIAALAPRESHTVDAMSVVMALVVILHVWWRLETADDASRVPLQWFAVTAGTVGLVAGLLLFAAEGASSNTPPSVVALMCAAIGPAMAIGVVRPDVVDVRGLIVWGVVACVAVVAYVSVFAGLISLLDWSGAPDLSWSCSAALSTRCCSATAPIRCRRRPGSSIASATIRSWPCARSAKPSSCRTPPCGSKVRRSRRRAPR
jgi:two-component system NarL family sensor kinase